MTNTEATTAKHLVEGARFHVAGRNGMGEDVHVALSIDRPPRAVVVQTGGDYPIRLSPNSKVWIEA